MNKILTTNNTASDFLNCFLTVGEMPDSMSHHDTPIRSPEGATGVLLTGEYLRGKSALERMIIRKSLDMNDL